MAANQIAREVFLSSLRPGDDFFWYGKLYRLREWSKDANGNTYAVCTDAKYQMHYREELKQHTLVTIVR